ncbi:preprotein translocase subunit YajC [Nonomuraea sp. NBC_01738]|uniref:preprotein translocase subunit YajC n=1 Tax=Nonomuraea sp. NBC_01738 TaxID=2976003 RepID=UPI002E15FB18|nr:preprotein translocase subunit YajC [Nonomuraea sp. NBC_01738]
MGSLGSILPLVLLVVVFYFLLIRPQRKRQQEASKMQNSLTPGTRVMTTTGLFATVVVVDNEDVILEVAPGIETRWVKAAIGRVISPGEPVAEEAEAEVEADAEPAADEVKDEAKGGDQDSSTKQS